MKGPLKIIEYLPGTSYLKKASCMICGDLVYDISEKPSKKEVDLAVLGLEAHLSIHHNIVFDKVPCEDPNCVKPHPPAVQQPHEDGKSPQDRP